jgi:hypothetical protein
MAIRAGVPIVLIATVGAADAMPVLIRGEQLSRVLRLDKLFRLKVFPLAIQRRGVLPRQRCRCSHLPGENPDQTVEVENEPDRAEDDEYVERKYFEVQNRIRAGMDALARKRALPLFG